MVKLVPGLLRLEVQDQGMLYPGLLARTITDHDTIPGGEKLSRLLSTNGSSSGNFFITYNISRFKLELRLNLRSGSSLRFWGRSKKTDLAVRLEVYYNFFQHVM